MSLLFSNSLRVCAEAVFVFKVLSCIILGGRTQVQVEDETCEKRTSVDSVSQSREPLLRFSLSLSILFLHSTFLPNILLPMNCVQIFIYIKSIYTTIYIYLYIYLYILVSLHVPFYYTIIPSLRLFFLIVISFFNAPVSF